MHSIPPRGRIPEPLNNAIRDAYAARGYLEARVTIGAVEFSGDAATLPISIDEGQAAQITSVQLVGVSPERRPGALEAIADCRGVAVCCGRRSIGTRTAGALLPRCRVSRRRSGHEGGGRLWRERTWRSRSPWSKGCVM